jgi:hexosaminidase
MVSGAGDTLKVKLESEIPGLDIYYSFDGTNPDNFYPQYTGASLNVPTGASEIRVITYRNGRPLGRQVNAPLEALKKKMKKK